MGSHDGGSTRGSTCPRCQAENDPALVACARCGQALHPLEASIGPGSVIAGRYEVLAPLGSGGMGVVFKARDRALDLDVAIKVLRAAAREGGLAARFRSEIKLAWKVRHPNVCGIHEYGESGDLMYISMELVEGRDLKQLLRERGAFLWEEAYDVSIQIARALAAIHEAGLIHRDLKTANVMRDRHGVVRVMDFGIAKLFGDADAGVTATGQVVGSPDYMSPEQVRGEPVDYRSDLYSLGLVIYEVFNGRLPFQAETPIAAMLQQLQAEPPLTGPQAAHIPVALAPILRKALAKRPDQRHASCRELLDDLCAARDRLAHQSTDSIGWAGGAVSGDDVPTQAPSAFGLAASTGTASQARLLVTPLLRALRHSDPSIRSGAVMALARMGDAAGTAVPQLAELVARDADPAIRSQAAQALGGIASMQEDFTLALQALRDASQDPDAGVRDTAVEAAAQLESLAGRGLSGAAPVDPPAPRPAGPEPAVAPAYEPAGPTPATPDASGAPADEPVEPAAAAEPSPGPTPEAAVAAAAAASLAEPADPTAEPEPPRSRGRERTPFDEWLSPGLVPAPPRSPRKAARRVLAAALGLAGVAGVAAGLAYSFRPSATESGPRPALPLPTPEPGAAEPAPTSTAATDVPETPSRKLEDKPAALETEKPRDRRRSQKEARAESVAAPVIGPAAADASRSVAVDPPPKPEPERSRVVEPRSEPTPVGPASPPPASPPVVPAIREPLPSPAATPSATPPAVRSAAVPSAPPVRPGDLVELTAAGVVAPVAIFDPDVDYPSIAARLQVQGTVQLRVLVDEKGKVVRVEVVSGPKELQQAALKKVNGRRYRPATRDGVPVKVWLPVSVMFKMR